MGSEGRAKLTEGNVRSTLLRMTGPMMFALVSMIAFNLVDTVFIGRLGARELSAVSFTFAPIFFLSSIAIGIGTGATSVISKTIGEGGGKVVKRLTSDTIILGVIVSIISSIIGILTIEPTFDLLGADEGLLPMVRSYMIIWYIGLPFVMVPILGNSIIRSTGDMKTPMYVMMIAISINLLLDPILIFGYGPVPAMGIEGAAWATAIARGFTLPASIYILRHRERMLIFGNISIKRLIRSWKEVLRIGLPASLVNMMAPVNTGIITAIIASEGDLYVGGFGAASRVEALMIMPVIALGIAAVPFIGQNLGAGRMDRVKEAVDFSFKAIVIFGLAAWALMALTADLTAPIFNDDPLVVSSYVDYIRIGDLGFYMLGIALFTASAFNGLNRPLPSAVLYFVRLLLLMIPLSLTGSYFWGVPGVYLGMSVANIIAGTMSYFWLRRAVRHPKEVILKKVPKIDCETDAIWSRLIGRPRECT
jgi:putative MATE family efflux protein